jgi:hypothetical protein
MWGSKEGIEVHRSAHVGTESCHCNAEFICEENRIEDSLAFLGGSILPILRTTKQSSESRNDGFENIEQHPLGLSKTIADDDFSRSVMSSCLGGPLALFGSG